MATQGGDSGGDRRQVYINWSAEKIRVEERPHPSFFFYEREVWWASLGKNIGHEIDGKNTNFERPVLILKKYSARICLVLPLTTQFKPGTNYQFQITLHESEMAALIQQSRTISSIRLLKKIDKLSPAVFNQITFAFIENIKKQPHWGRVVEFPARPETNLI